MSNSELPPPMKSEADYVTSVGGFGFQERTDNRLVFTPTVPITTGETLKMYIDETTHRLPDTEYGRAMVRGLVTKPALYQVAQEYPDVLPFLEVAIPLQNDIWFAVFGQNGSQRQSNHSHEDFSRIRVTAEKKTSRSALTHLDRITENGNHIITDLRDTQMQRQLGQLWEERFGWTPDDISHFAQRLAMQEEGVNRQMWFSGVVDQSGKLKAVAMAEALDFPTGSGDTIRFVESTEWATLPGGGEGESIAAAVAHVGSQVFYDNKGVPVMLFAEVNAANAAPKIARMAGFEFPQGIRVGNHEPLQVLHQNVQIGDNEKDTTTHRDFFWVGVDEQARAMYYADGDNVQVVQRTRI